VAGAPCQHCPLNGLRVTHAQKSTFRVRAAEGRLRINLGLQVGSVGALLELWHGPTPYWGQLRGIGIGRRARRPLFPIVDSIQLRGSRLRVEALRAHVGLDGWKLGRIWAGCYMVGG
jgi:hypothetical protein